uniref:WGS project CAEQ00000000 data, annotated contig 699 n=1 Tax=Trypanosoma congolense (strain IL3000) TaxID=1068625 RepID=F9WHW6_TRYCI|nr:unnamed protein product [Trypanosoma congolense IL3000]
MKLPFIANGFRVDDSPGRTVNNEPSTVVSHPCGRFSTVKLDRLNPPSPYKPTLPPRRYPLIFQSLPRLNSTSNGRFGTVTLDLMSFGMKKNMTAREASYEFEYMCFLNLVKEEKMHREDIIFEEQRVSTHYWVKYLEEASVYLSTDVRFKEEEMRNVIEREEERRRMCYIIEMTSAVEHIQKRLEISVEKALLQIMPLYLKDRDALMETEEQCVRGILNWFKEKKPFNMLLPAFLKEESKMLRQEKLPTLSDAGHARTVASRKRYYAATPMKRASPNSILEDSFMEAGRKAWKEEKERIYRKKRAVWDRSGILESETAARDGVIREERFEWKSLEAIALNSMYDVKLIHRQKEDELRRQEEEKQAEMEKRKTIFAKLEREEAEKDKRGRPAALSTAGSSSLMMRPLVESHFVNPYCGAKGPCLLPSADQGSGEVPRAEAARQEEVVVGYPVGNQGPAEEHVKEKEAGDEEDRGDLVEMMRNVDIQNCGCAGQRDLLNELIDEHNALDKLRCLEAVVQFHESMCSDFEDAVDFKISKEEINTFKTFQSSILSRDSDSSESAGDVPMPVEDERAILNTLRAIEDNLACNDTETRIVPLLQSMEEAVEILSERRVFEKDLRRQSGMLEVGEVGADKCGDGRDILRFLTDLGKCVSIHSGSIPPMAGSAMDEMGNVVGTTDVAPEKSADPSANSIISPAPNTVKNIAAKRDLYISLKDSPLNTAGNAGRSREGTENSKVEHMGCAFADEQNAPLCPIYLVHGIWQRDNSCLVAPTQTNNTLENSIAQLIYDETRLRSKIINDQIVRVWSLYRAAAEDASQLTKTNCGDLFYMGARIVNETYGL